MDIKSKKELPNNEGWRLSFLWTLIATSLIIFLIRITRIFPEIYFSFSELIYGYGRYLPPLAVVIRFAIPFAIGFLITFKKGITHIEATASGFLASFLLVWPCILVPDRVLEHELYQKRYVLYVVYVLFIISITFISRSGAILAERIMRNKRTEAMIREEILSWKNTIKPIIIGVLSAIIYSIIIRNL